MSFLEVKNLSKEYEMGEVKVYALSKINLSFDEGSFVVILGHSGSGKSTLLNIIGGMDIPTTGEVIYKEKHISLMNEKELTEYRRQNVGFVFQFFNLMTYLTAKENVELATEISNDPLEINGVMNEVGLQDRANHFPSQMSGGEQQRVAIARAVAKNSDLLLCDEPTGALDSKTGIEVLRVLKRIHEKYKKTIIIITHNASIANIADRVIRLNSGEVVEDYRNENPVEVDRIEW
ncbi:MAG: ABC transporter ATP-binding protein [Vulcanibacillus sp.]